MSYQESEENGGNHEDSERAALMAQAEPEDPTGPTGDLRSHIGPGDNQPNLHEQATIHPSPLPATDVPPKVEYSIQESEPGSAYNPFPTDNFQVQMHTALKEFVKQEVKEVEEKVESLEQSQKVEMANQQKAFEQSHAKLREDFTTQLDSAAAQINALQGKVESLEKNLKDHQKEVASLKKKLADAQSEVVSLKGELEDKDKTIEDKDKTIEDLKEKLEDKDKTIEDLKEKLEDKDKTTEDLKKILKDTRRELSAAIARESNSETGGLATAATPTHLSSYGQVQVMIERTRDMTLQGEEKKEPEDPPVEDDDEDQPDLL